MKFCSILAAALLALPLTAISQNYPVRPVRIVVPYAPGGGIDGLARAISERLSPKWGRPVVVDNKPGAASIIGAEIVARAAPDGHTLLLTSESTVVSNPFLYPKLPYDAVRDLAPITQLVSLPQMVVAHASVNVNTLDELVALLRAKPNSLNYGSYGSGSTPHLLFEALKARSKVELTQVPYKGIIPALAATVAGEVQLTMVGVSLSIGHIKAGKIKPIAIARGERLPSMPQVPTLREAGYADIDPHEGWFGLFVTSGSPEAVVRKVHADVVEAFADPEFRAKQVLARGFDPVFSTPEAFARFIQSEMKQMAHLIKVSGAKAE
ncbi:MAG: tripartite tricarboxylate transporter substrate binding protein [Burkholderiales bacterium]|nr:tripartite tricarboxylate transporter substrate binding protein [Burkholderiales bacterium]